MPSQVNQYTVWTFAPYAALPQEKLEDPPLISQGPERLTVESGDGRVLSTCQWIHQKCQYLKLANFLIFDLETYRIMTMYFSNLFQK